MQLISFACHAVAGAVSNACTEQNSVVPSQAVEPSWTSHASSDLVNVSQHDEQDGPAGDGATADMVITTAMHGSQTQSVSESIQSGSQYSSDIDSDVTPSNNAGNAVFDNRIVQPVPSAYAASSEYVSSVMPPQDSNKASVDTYPPDWYASTQGRPTRSAPNCASTNSAASAQSSLHRFWHRGNIGSGLLEPIIQHPQAEHKTQPTSGHASFFSNMLKSMLAQRTFLKEMEMVSRCTCLLCWRRLSSDANVVSMLVSIMLSPAF